MQKEALLNDSDSLWAEFRHAHIGKVLTDLGESATRTHAPVRAEAAAAAAASRPKPVDEVL